MPSSVSILYHKLLCRTFLVTCGPPSPAGQSGNMCWAGFLSLGIPLLGGDRGPPCRGRREKGPLEIAPAWSLLHNWYGALAGSGGASAWVGVCDPGRIRRCRWASHWPLWPGLLPSSASVPRLLHFKMTLRPLCRFSLPRAHQGSEEQDALLPISPSPSWDSWPT